MHNQKIRFTNKDIKIGLGGGSTWEYINIAKLIIKNISDIAFKENNNKPRFKSSSYRSFPSRFRQVFNKNSNFLNLNICLFKFS